jgi:hypothetical protein
VGTSPFSSPVVLDATLSDEKMQELLSLKAEYPTLDFKTELDLATTEGVVELAKDVGAMQVDGAYVIVGVDGQGEPTGRLDEADMRLFDEANLVPKLRKYLPEPLELRTRIVERDGHKVILISVGPHPSGFAIFQADGTYERKGKEVVRFRAGEIFWRDGTRSVRLTQPGFERIVARRIAAAKHAWIDEQQEIRRRERAELEAAYESRSAAAAPLGAVNIDLETSVLTTAALELVRAGDRIPLQHLLMDAVARARALIEADEVEAELGDVVDKLTCLAATFLVYGQTQWLGATIATLSEIFTLGFGDEPNSDRFGLSTFIPPTDKGPRTWLLIIERIYALGALAVRRRDWGAVRTLTLQLPEKIDEYYGNWLRFALTMSSRAQHLSEQQDGREIHISLLSRVLSDTGHLACVRPDGVDDDQYLTTLAQFDVLSNLVAVDGSGRADDRVFYPNFARFRQTRIQPVVDRIVDDPEMREILFPRNDGDLALALTEIAKTAQQIGFRYDGFWSWDRTPVGEFISAHPPEQPQTS